jgi:hypothetical protein
MVNYSVALTKRRVGRPCLAEQTEPGGARGIDAVRRTSLATVQLDRRVKQQGALSV